MRESWLLPSFTHVCFNFIEFDIQSRPSKKFEVTPAAEQRCSWRAPFPGVRSVRVDPLEHPGAQALDFAQALRHAPLPFCPPAVQHVEEPVAHGVLPCCCWARLQRVQRLEWVGGAQSVLVWAISSCVSGRVMAPPGRHQSGRCKRTPRGSPWWWWMCS